MFNIITEDKSALISVTEHKKGEISYLEVDYKTENAKIPERFSIKWNFFNKDCCSVVSPAVHNFRGKGMNWVYQKTTSRLAAWMPIHCIISRNEHNRLNITVSDAQTPIEINSGIVEQNGFHQCKVDFFTIPTTPITEYHATIRLDYRDIPYYDSIYSSVEYWENECGYKPALVPDAARLPMDSLWYSFHQDLTDEAIFEECKASKALGMETVIIDDGWQTDNNVGGYAYCGDWKMSKEKIADMKGLVDRLHGIGMKVMLWFSIPYIGFYSENYEKYKDKLLSYNEKTKYGVFDPRYKEVRDFLAETYEGAVREWGLDGLKLDFIDSFVLTEESARFDERRDFESLEQAIDCLLKDVTERLYRLNSDILIEFRQSYVGPSIRKYANMLRVNDCPGDSLRNRAEIINLRFTSGKTAVHSDMMMWHLEDSNEEVACQLLNTLYGVPQISAKVDKIADEHKMIVKRYLELWKKYRSILLDGYFEAMSPESFYSQARSTKDGFSIISVYINPLVKIKEEKNIIFNVSGRTEICVENAKNFSFSVEDCLGNAVSKGTVKEKTEIIDVPIGGTLYLNKI